MCAGDLGGRSPVSVGRIGAIQEAGLGADSSVDGGHVGHGHHDGSGDRDIGLLASILDLRRCGAAWRGSVHTRREELCCHRHQPLAATRDWDHGVRSFFLLGLAGACLQLCDVCIMVLCHVCVQFVSIICVAICEHH